MSRVSRKQMMDYNLYMWGLEVVGPQGLEPWTARL